MVRPAWLIVSAAALLASASAQQPPVTAGLVHNDDLHYVGAFRLPGGPDDQHTFAYGGTAPAFSAERKSLFVVGHDWYQRVAEVAIPEIRAAASIDGLATAPLRQPFTDVLQGHMKDVGDGSVKIGGLLPTSEGLIVTAFVYYDAAASQKKSHFVTGLDFAHLPEVRGPFQVGTAFPQAGFVSGYMTPVPPEWQQAFGGTALTGQCCISIISRTSYGPSASVFNPADLGVRTPAPASTLLAYPQDHPTLGRYESSHTGYNGTTKAASVVFPDGTRSVLFVGRAGTGRFCYGTGTADQSLDGKPARDGTTYCYDPTATAKGEHSFPYLHQIWAYDALDLLAVKQRKKSPWDIRPYATWNFDLPFQTDIRQISGAAYDPATRRLFIVAPYQDGVRPLVHVFTIGKPN